jgi:hypothetical protein
MAGSSPHAISVALAACAIAIAASWGSAACTYHFDCEDDGECVRDGVAGHCSSGGGCFFEDTTCASGFAWDSSSRFRSLSTPCAQPGSLGLGSPRAMRALEGGRRFDPAASLPQRVGPIAVVEWIGLGGSIGGLRPGFVVQSAPGEEALLIAVDPSTLDPMPVPGALVELTLERALVGSFLPGELAEDLAVAPELAFDAISAHVVTDMRVRLPEVAVSANGDVPPPSHSLVSTRKVVGDNWALFPGGYAGVEVAVSADVSYVLLASHRDWPALSSFGSVSEGCEVRLPHAVSFPLSRERPVGVSAPSFFGSNSSRFRGLFMGPDIAVSFGGCPQHDPVGAVVITEMGVFHSSPSPFYEMVNLSEADFDLAGCVLENYEVRGLPGVGEVGRIVIPGPALVPPGGIAVLGLREIERAVLTGWTDPRSGSVVDPVFVPLGDLVGVVSYHTRAGIQLTCAGQLIDRVVLSSRDADHLGHAAGIDFRDLREDNRDGYRWCFQATSFGEGIGTPGAPNDPCYD